MRILGVILFSFFFYFINYAQQSTVFNNYIETSYYNNPSISSPLKKELFTAYRNHWSGFPGAPRSFLVAYQTPLLLNANAKTYSSLGGYLKSDIIGAFKANTLNFSYSYSFLLNDRLRCSCGSFIGLKQLALDITNFNIYQANDPIIDVSNSAILNPDFSFGVVVFNNTNFFGFSYNNILNRNWRKIILSENSQTESSIIISGGKIIKFSNFSFSPNFLINYSTNFNTLFLLGIDLDYQNKLGIGLISKNDNALISRLKINLTNNFKIIYGYEFRYTSLAINTTNSHEFLISYHSSIVEKMKRSKLVSYF